MAATTLPNLPLSVGPYGSAFRQVDRCQTLMDAVDHVRGLPYGRTSTPHRYLSVLEEGRGTCSSKHGLVALLAEEMSVDIALTLATFEMSEQTHPAVGPVLRSHGLEAILEAHCYLRYGEVRLDLTWPREPEDTAVEYAGETRVAPLDLEAEKPRYHHNKLEEWRQAKGLSTSLEELWSIRELCIAGLTSSP